MNPRLTRFLLCAFAVCGLLFSTAAAQTTITVSTTDDELNSDGDCSLREAVQTFNTNSAVDACATPAGAPFTIDLGASTYMITIAGVGEDANATGDFDITGTAALTITGSGEVDGNDEDRIFHLFAGTNVTMNGFRLMSGSLTTTSPTDGGGCVLNAGTFTLTNAVVNSCFVEGPGSSGGGLLNVSGTVTIANTVFSLNDADRAGGAIESNAGTMTLTNVTFDRNTTGITNPIPGNGGAIHITGNGNATITGGSATDNQAASEGGAFWNSIGTMTIDGTSITSNDSFGAGADNGGGGVFNNGGTLDIDNATISSNTATTGAGSGGGILSTDGTVTTDNTTIASNSANRAGGGIEIIDGTMTLTNVTLGGASATAGNFTGPSPGNGGGLHVTGTSGTTVTVNGGLVRWNVAASEGGGLWGQTGSTLIVNGTSIRQNDAQGDPADNGGGGIFNNGGTLDVNDARIESNLASGAAGSGGGVFSIGGSVTIDGSVISQNEAKRAGGAVEVTGGTVAIATTSMLNNDLTDAGVITGNSPGNGGAIHVGDGVVTVDQSTMAGNRAGAQGGGVWNNAAGTSVLTVTRSTLQGNLAPVTSGGGAAYQVGGGSGTTTIRESTLSGNSSPAILNAGSTVLLGNSIVANSGDGDDPDLGGSTTSEGFNLVETVVGAVLNFSNSGRAAPTDVTNQDPMLEPLAGNGGPTLTLVPMPGSPAVDAGNATSSIDQRGQPRIVDASAANAGNGSDIGSVEAQQSELPVELTGFDALADEAGVTLTWTTATETDNAGFFVERRAFDVASEQVAGSGWISLGFVDGVGTTTEAQSYRFRADALPAGRHAFRLKQVDFDGAFEYSGEVEATVAVPNSFVLSEAYPNPFNPTTNINLVVATEQRVQLVAYDVIGRKVATVFAGVMLANERQTFTFEAGSLPSGLYLLRAEGESFTAVRQVMLSK